MNWKQRGGEEDIQTLNQDAQDTVKESTVNRYEEYGTDTSDSEQVWRVKKLTVNRYEKEPTVNRYGE